jgi:hypothetical protein
MVSFSFGKRRKRYNVAGSSCNRLKKRVCRSNPNCSYTRRGCRRRSGTATRGVVYEGPSLQFGRVRRRRVRRVSDFGKRRKRYNVAGSSCNRLKKRVCRSNPNCSYTRRGCRRRSGTVSRGLVYEGPSLEFGKRRKTGRKTRRRKTTRRRSGRKVHKKLPAKIRKLCKRLKIKCTKKVGSRRVYKRMSVLKKQIARKMRKMRRHRR